VNPHSERNPGLTNPAWAQSEPPRGSGWVRSLSKRVYDVPTRYRKVVLTVPKPD